MPQQILTGSTLVCIGAGTHVFTIWTPGLAATLLLADTGSLPLSSPVQEGASVAFSGTLAGDQTLRFGPVAYHNTIYPKLWFLGSLGIVATAVQIPAGSALPVTVQAPFVLTGNLRAYAQNATIGNPGPAIFDVALKGKGTVVAGLSAPFGAPGAMLRSVQSLVYAFAG